MSEEFERALNELDRDNLADILRLLHSVGGGDDQMIEIVTLYHNLDGEGRQRVRAFVDDLTD